MFLKIAQIFKELFFFIKERNLILTRFHFQKGLKIDTL